MTLRFCRIHCKSGAKLRKISRFKHKNGSDSTFFYEKTHFFAIFVCFINTFPYICVSFLNNNFIFTLLKLTKL